MRRTGYVRRWCPDRGFGLIFNDNGSGEEFVHFSSLAATGLQALTPGMDVSFELAPRGDKFHAVNVRVLDRAPE